MNKKVLIFTTEQKDKDGLWTKYVSQVLQKNDISFTVINNDDLSSDFTADAIIVLGGDGTVLSAVDFSQKNNIPILAINAGKVGFLSEFQNQETELAINLFKNDELVKDERILLDVFYKDATYKALNDVVVERIYSDNLKGLVTNIQFYLDGQFISSFLGNGVIVSTPTGSTAYSLSSNGPVLAPKINALTLTPVCAQSLIDRPIVFSADSFLEIKYLSGSDTAVFVDGKLAVKLEKNDVIKVKKAKETVTFLRKNDFNFYKKLNAKLNKDRYNG